MAGSRSFDGSGDFAWGEFLPAVGTGDWTVGIWTYWQGDNFIAAFQIGSDDDGQCILLNVGFDGGSRWTPYAKGPNQFNGANTGTTQPALNTWQFVAVRYHDANTTLQLIVDGVQDPGSTNNAPFTLPSVERTIIGGRSNGSGDPTASLGQAWKGKLAHFAVWSRAVPNSELADMYDNLKSPKFYPTNLVEYFPLIGATTPEESNLTDEELTVVNATADTGPGLSNPPGAALEGTVSVSFNVSGALTTSIVLAADVTVSASISGTLTTYLFYPRVRVYIDGEDVTSVTRQAGFNITKSLAGDSAGLMLAANLPDAVWLGKELEIYVGEATANDLLFAGHISSMEQAFEGGDVATLPVWHILATGYEWTLSRVPVLGTWRSVSLTSLVTALRDGWAPEWDLSIDPQIANTVIEEFPSTDDDLKGVLNRIATAVGAEWYGYPAPNGGRTLTFFSDPEWFGNTIPAADYSQLRLRQDAGDVYTSVWSQGGGSAALVTVPASGANSIPVADASWYAPLDVLSHETYTVTPYLISGTQRFTYTGRSLIAYDGRSTSTVPRPTNLPTTPSVAQANAGNVATYISGNLPAGTYRYRVSYVTANGESEASSAATGTVNEIAAPLVGVMQAVSDSNTGGLFVHGTETEYYQFSVSYGSADGGESAASAAVTGLMVVGHNAFHVFDIPVSPDGRVTKRHIYCSTPTNPTRRLVHTINDNSTTAVIVLGSFSSTVAPTTASGATGKLDLSNIFIGGAGTTSRKIYRTAKNGSVFKLLTTIADNSTTTYLDNIADGSLGADLTSNTAAAGPGDTTLRVVDLGQLPPSGWVQVGANIVRYSGRSATSGTGTLTGIPAIGYGAITATIAPEESVVFVPSIEGVSGISAEIRKGEEISVLWSVESTIAVANTSNTYGFPFWTKIIDGRASSTEARRRGIAKLLLHRDPVQTVTYVTRDMDALPGRTVSIDVGGITGEYRIQTVRITRELLPPDTLIFPKRTVEASSKRFTFAGLLSQLRR